MTIQINPREIAVQALLEILKEEKYNTTVLRKLLKQNGAMPPKDRAFVTEIVNGSLRNLYYIDFVIDNVSHVKMKKIKPYILAVLRTAGAKSIETIEDDFEIVSATGTVSKNGCHIHVSVSDDKLKTYGGHLKKGCIINTTVELILLELDNIVFTREMDEKTGYKELVVKEEKRCQN